MTDQTSKASEKLLGAAQGGDVTTVRKLVQLATVDLNEADEKGYTALHHSAYFDEPEIVDLLLKDMRTNWKATTTTGLSCLHLAAMNNSLRAVDTILKSERLPKEQVLELSNNWGETPLHVAAAAGHARVVEALLAFGFSLLKRDQWNRSPLMVAKEHGEKSTMDALLDACKGLEIDTEERSPVVEHQHHHSTRNKQIMDDFMNSLKARNKEVDVSQVKVKHVIDFEPKKPETATTEPKVMASPTTQKISLSKKIEYPGDFQAIKDLLEKGEVSAGTKVWVTEEFLILQDMFGLTALHKFASWDKVDLIQLLLPYLNDQEVNLQSGEEGFTALHWCIEMGSSQCLDLLLKDGRIKKDVTDKKGRTAEVLAKEMGDESAVKALADEK